MPNRRLLAIVTALACLGASGAGAYTIEQLRDIERLIVSRDCGGLRSYLGSNPRLLSGNDPLSFELRSFVNGIDTGLIACLSYRADEATQPEPFALTLSQSY